MNVHEFLNTYLGGNKNISTLTYDALAEMLADYAKALQLQQTGVMRSNCIDESPETRINVNRFNDDDYDEHGYFLR